MYVVEILDGTDEDTESIESRMFDSLQDAAVWAASAYVWYTVPEPSIVGIYHDGSEVAYFEYPAQAEAFLAEEV